MQGNRCPLAVERTARYIFCTAGALSQDLVVSQHSTGFVINRPARRFISQCRIAFDAVVVRSSFFRETFLMISQHSGKMRSCRQASAFLLLF